MTNRLMISVAAAALIAGTGFANAQGTGMGREGAVGRRARCSRARHRPHGRAVGAARSAGQMNRDAADGRHEVHRSPDDRSRRRGARTSAPRTTRHEAKSQNRHEGRRQSKGMSTETRGQGRPART